MSFIYDSHANIALTAFIFRHIKSEDDKELTGHIVWATESVVK
jgi:hypothetical protein